jgi:hypothetical protein
LKGRSHLGELCADEKIISKLIFKKKGVRVNSTGFRTG